MSKDRSIAGTTTTGTGGYQAGGRGTSSRLPTAPRERKPALAALAVLLILAGALSTMLLVTRTANRVDVVIMVHQVNAGTPVGEGDIADQQVAADNSMHYFLWSQKNVVIGHAFPISLVPGTLLVQAMYGTSASDGPAKGQVAITVVLKAGQYPDGLVNKGYTLAIYQNTSSNNGSSSTNNGSSTTAAQTYVGTGLVLSESGNDTIHVTLSVKPDEVVPIVNAGTNLVLVLPGS